MANFTTLDFVLFAVVGVVMPIIAGLNWRTLTQAPAAERKLVRFYASIIVRDLILVALIVIAWIDAGRAWPALGFDWPIGPLGCAGFAFDALIVVFYALALMRLRRERAPEIQTRLDRLQILPRTPHERAIFPLVALVASPTEELLFRGYLMWALTPFVSVWGAVAISSIMFGLMHAYQGRQGVVRTTLIGVAFGAGFALTQSLWWLMLAHTLINIFGGVVAERVRRLLSASASSK